jgi:hypothetical protein
MNSAILKMKTTDSSETSVPTYQTMQWHIPEDCDTAMGILKAMP